MKRILTSGILLLGSGCSSVADGGSEDLSTLGGIIGTVIGFALFGLFIFLDHRRQG